MCMFKDVSPAELDLESVHGLTVDMMPELPCMLQVGHLSLLGLLGSCTTGVTRLDLVILCPSGKSDDPQPLPVSFISHNFRFLLTVVCFSYFIHSHSERVTLPEILQK